MARDMRSNVTIVQHSKVDKVDKVEDIHKVVSSHQAFISGGLPT